MSEFANYKEKQRHFEELYKNRATVLCQQPFGSVKFENGKWVRKFKGVTFYKVKEKGDL